MQSLRPEDISMIVVGDKAEFRRRQGDKLLFTLPRDQVSVTNVAAMAWNVATTQGMELGRTMLQEELRDLLGVAGVGPHVNVDALPK